MYKIRIEPYLLRFKQPAGTSRGVYTTHKVWLLHLTDSRFPDREGVGECAPLPDLSCDAFPDYEARLRRCCRQFEEEGVIDYESLRSYPSILFGLETALRSLRRWGQPLWDSSFARGECSLTINGLVWMGSYEEMRKRLEEKIAQHFHCIKLKIGAIDFEKELALIQRIRADFPKDKVELRVDANGAFSPETALAKLETLARYDLHSIEQPVKAGQWREMAHLCRETPLPIALDEELIGVNDPQEKVRLLETIKPQYIILKPSLHGGIKGAEEWIRLAEERGVRWWATSALESNVGLEAIACWCATFRPHCPQGLGTGMLYTNNTPSRLELKGDQLWYKPSIKEDFLRFKSEWENDSLYMEVQTSGSTGTPKHLKVEKELMRHSARMTCRFLRLKEGDTALLCMPLRYIGGKMVCVRAFTANLRLKMVEPSSHPLRGMTESPVFAAMTPMQVYASLQVPEERECLRGIRELIIGGGAVHEDLRQALKDFPHRVWSTYGMTETLSHVALRRLNGADASDRYTPLEGVEVSLSADHTLCIYAPAVCAERLETNDIAEIFPDGTFRVIGRKDNVIDSGGVKIQIEEVEERLRPHLSFPFLITSLPDAKFGEVVVLLVQDAASDIDFERVFLALPPYWRPKRVISVKRIPLTGSGKPDRANALKLAREMV